MWVVDPVNETVAPREIEVGQATRNGLRIVYDGLRPGEQVVVESNGRLQPGVRVSARKE